MEKKFCTELNSQELAILYFDRTVSQLSRKNSISIDERLIEIRSSVSFFCYVV